MADTIEEWRSKAESKRSGVAAQIPKAWRLPESTLQDIHQDSDANVLDIPRRSGILSEKELDITEKYDATTLAEKIARKELSSYDITLAFCKRAAIAQQVTRCLTEIMFDDALEIARSRDEHLERTGTTLGPLHGVPISLKDSFNVKGVQSTIGYVSFLDRPPADSHSPFVEALLQQGAVPYVKTNVPQTMMVADSDNHIFGRTLNPHRLRCTAGGSSGGEGALLALRGSVLGVGTDIAGSIRIPALCNGVLGFKPTVGRLPAGGAALPGRPGAFGILSCAGPLGRSVRDLELLMKAVVDTGPWRWDEKVIPVPWRTVQPPLGGAEERKLKLGWLLEDHDYPLHPPILRAMTMAQDAIKVAGHEIVQIGHLVPSLKECTALAWKYFNLDPRRTSLKNVSGSGEPVISSIPGVKVKELEDWTASLDEVFDMNVRRAEIIETYKDLMVSEELDAIVMPAYQGVAPPHDTYGLPPYTVLTNILDFPSCCLPYSKASKQDDASYFRANVEYIPPYDPDTSDGMPCSIQVVGKPMHDEELMKIAETLATVIGF